MARVLLNCVDFRRYNPGDGPNPRSEHGMRFQVLMLNHSPNRKPGSYP